ncbi:MAG: MBOAT family protein [Helicobacteraceae bacterium]|nr:MBOAT family protein [Helicobacteraceae bacterium]
MLPLAISFFTFQQIAFLVDCYKQRKDSTKSLETKTESTLNIKNTNLNEVLECEDSIIKHKKESNLILDSKDSQSLNINTTIESKTFNYNASINPNIPNNQAKVIKYSAPLDFLDYCLFVCFFPQLIAGPIVHHKEMMPQFNNLQNKRKDKKLNLDSKVNAEIKKENESLEAKLNKSNVDSKLDSTLNIESNSINLINHNKQYLDSKVESNSIPNQINQNKTSFLDYKLIAKGLFIFSIGLFKKVFIADSFAKWANKGFEAVENGIVLNVVESWATSLSYTYQLYFDFSGYCDMAIGLGLLFGIVLPINFYSPYKALNITIFWRKWHITLGRFLKDYIYIPLGGNKNSINKIKNNILTLRSLFLVAFISGIWHGAGWGFIIWGTMHGIAMVIHRAYRFIIDYFLQKEENRKKEDNKYLKTIMECKSNLDSKVELESTNNINIQSLDSKSNLALDSNHNKFNSFHRFTRFSLKSFLDSTFYKVICFIITFNFINIAWIFFRSENVSGAINLLRGMFGVEWVDLPLKWWRMPETLKTIEGRNETIIYIILAFVVCLWIRNSWEMARAFSGRVWEVVLFAVFIQISFSCMQDATIQEFIYFNF